MSEQAKAYKKTICIDFDGVIHSYERGWQEGELYGTVTEGFFEWANEAQKKFNLVIYSSRSSNLEMIKKMKNWLLEQFLKQTGLEMEIPKWQFAEKKPPAWITIDDRCICFEGSWAALELQPNMIEDFKIGWILHIERQDVERIGG